MIQNDTKALGIVSSPQFNITQIHRPQAGSLVLGLQNGCIALLMYEACTVFFFLKLEHTQSHTQMMKASTLQGAIC